MGLWTVVQCRLIQQGNRLVKALRRVPRQELQTGVGSLFTLGQFLRDRRLKKPLVVIAGSETNARLKLEHALTSENFPPVFYDEVPGRPTEGHVADIVRAYDQNQCDSLIAVGSGELIDVVKGAAASRGAGGKSIRTLADRRQKGRKIPPVIAVPTCAGSGAEAMDLTVLADEKGGFLYLEGTALLPEAVFMDPELLMSVDRRTLADAAMNGVCWAVEGYLATGFGDQRTKNQAAEALELLFASLVPCWNNGGSESERRDILHASHMIGQVAMAAGCGYARALIRASQTVCGISFAEGCGIILPMVLEKYGNSALEELANLAVLADIVPEGSREERAAALIQAIRSMAFHMGLPDELEHVTESQAKKIAELAEKRANPKYISPVIWSAEDCFDVIVSVCKNTV